MEKENKIKISVCISVHNTGHLLSRCLDSVLSQTYENIEIILINNGSTDNSFDIMREYERKTSNIFVYSQDDLGLAQGRQSGVNKATGDYITFLDADDYIMPEMYEKMVDIVEKTNADIVECETKKDNDILSSKYSGLHNAKDILASYFKGEYILSMLWLRIYRKKLFDAPVLPDIYTNNEDIYALPCLLYAADTIYFLKECLHTYSTDNDDAEMKKIYKKRYDDKRIFEIKMKALGAVDFIQKYIGISNINQKYNYEFNCFKSRNITYFCIADYKKVSVQTIIDEICKYFNMNEKELNCFFRNNNSNPVTFEKIWKLLGLRKAIYLYRFLKKIKS